MRFRLAVSVLMATLLVACESPTSPSSPYMPQAGTPSPAPSGGPTPLPSSVPGSTNQVCLVDDLVAPLPTATVGFSDGQTVRVNATGCASIPTGQTVAWAEAPGFRQLTDFPLQREDVPLPQGTYALWPTAGYLEQLEMQDGVYANSYPDFSGYRPRSGVFTVALPDEMVGASTTDMDQYRSALELVLGNASDQSSNKVVFTVSAAPSANIRIVVDPTVRLASFEPTISGPYITGGVLKVHSIDKLLILGLMRHELAHPLGVEHYLQSGYLMHRSPSDDGFATEAEVIHFRMRFLRSPGFDARKG